MAYSTAAFRQADYRMSTQASLLESILSPDETPRVACAVPHRYASFDPAHSEGLSTSENDWGAVSKCIVFMTLGAKSFADRRFKDVLTELLESRSPCI